MYSQSINGNANENLLYWMVGYKNSIKLSSIFPYIAPNINTGSMKTFIIQLYKCPNNETNFIKINNIDKSKAFQEFNNYIKKNNINPVKTIKFIVKGDTETKNGEHFFNILSKFQNKTTYKNKTLH